MPSKIRRLWNEKYGNDDIYKSFIEATFCPKSKVKNIFGMFSVLVDFIVSLHLIRIKGADSIQQIINYVDSHPELNLTLGEAADMLNCSISSLTHSFKKATGRSFKNYVIYRKILTAQELLASPDGLTVSQVANRVGYEDPFLFSRIYKKHTGRAPSSNRASST
jgi:AraC-like DNA-binding protein